MAVESGGFDIREGARVWGSDGQEIGAVTEVWPESRGEVIQGTGGEAVGGTGPLHTNPGLLGTGGSITSPIVGTPRGAEESSGPGIPANADLPSQPQPLRSAGGGYFKVDRGGFLGIGGRDLYVPFSGVMVADETGVRLNVTADEASNRGWQNRPAWLD